MGLRLRAALAAVTLQATEGRAMESVEQRIKKDVSVSLGWKANEVRVDPLPDLKRGKCSFFTAAQTVRPIPYMPTYVALDNDALVSGTDPSALAKIYKSCGADAPASWQAEVIDRFHKDLGGVVVRDEQRDGPAVRKLRSMGKTFTPPTVTGATVSFFMLDPEAFILYAVKAERQADGNFKVEKNAL
jgi:hypothetical protein